MNTPRNTQKLVSTQKRSFLSMLVQKFTILQFFFYKSILDLLKPRGVNTAKADRTMTAQSEKSIICKKPRLTALHAGIVLTPPLTRSERCNIQNMSRRKVIYLCLYFPLLSIYVFTVIKCCSKCV